MRFSASITKVAPDDALAIDEIVDELNEPTSPSPFLYLFGILFAGAMLFAWGNEFHIVNSMFGFGWLSVLLSLIMTGALFTYMVKRDGMPSMRETGGALYGRGSELGFSFVVFVILPFMACMWGFPGLARVANCLLDTSTPQMRVVRKTGVAKQGSKMEAGKRSWLMVIDGDTRRWIPIARKQVAEMEYVKSIRLTTRSGALGGEWVSGVEPAAE